MLAILRGVKQFVDSNFFKEYNVRATLISHRLFSLGQKTRGNVLVSSTLQTHLLIYLSL